MIAFRGSNQGTVRQRCSFTCFFNDKATNQVKNKSANSASHMLSALLENPLPLKIMGNTFSDKPHSCFDLEFFSVASLAEISTRITSKASDYEAYEIQV